LCDGSITLKGLTPNKQVTVDYELNGMQPGKYATNVAPDGNVKIPNLCAGNYTGIVARIKRKNAMGKQVILADPNVSIASQSTSNPTSAGLCNGSATFSGKYTGKAVTINYSRDGVSQAAFTGYVSSENSITVNGLCEGKYTGVVVSVNNCSANGTDFTLAAPVSPAPAPPPPTVTRTGKIDITTPILFDLNQSVIHESFYSEIDEAAAELRENMGATLIIDGHADITGPEVHNIPLSESRANSVKYQLTKRGISPDRIKVIGHGSRIPAEPNNTWEGRQENRRAIMTIVPAGR